MGSEPTTKIERPRSVAEIIGEALDTYQRYPLLFIILALGVIAPYELVVLAVTGHGPLVNQSHETPTTQVILIVLDSALVGPLVSALYVHAVTLIGEGRRPRLGEVAARGLRVLPEVSAAVIVSSLGILLGFLALIVPGIILFLRWAVVAQVAAIERQGWLPALRRSAELTRGNYLHVLGVLVVAGLLAAGFTVLAGALPLGSTSGALSVAVGIAARTIAASFGALALALLYFDLRARAAGPSEPAPSDYEPPSGGE
ncbi:MAG TPA: hypothetical protein VG010_08705 [Solirubrobacteraceae bacterium]|nr:hypothetical protein [Solirubrobacteraceae bacterium]